MSGQTKRFVVVTETKPRLSPPKFEYSFHSYFSAASADLDRKKKHYMKKADKAVYLIDTLKQPFTMNA